MRHTAVLLATLMVAVAAAWAAGFLVVRPTDLGPRSLAIRFRDLNRRTRVEVRLPEHGWPRLVLHGAQPGWPEYTRFGNGWVRLTE